MGGSATLLAVRALADRLRKVGAALLEAHEDDIVLAEGAVGVKGAPHRRLSFKALAHAGGGNGSAGDHGDTRAPKGRIQDSSRV